jgi:hypothetical protein
MRRNGASTLSVIAGKAVGRDPESRPLAETVAAKKLLCTLEHLVDSRRK